MVVTQIQFRVAKCRIISAHSVVLNVQEVYCLYLFIESLHKKRPHFFYIQETLIIYCTGCSRSLVHFSVTSRYIKRGQDCQDMPYFVLISFFSAGTQKFKIQLVVIYIQESILLKNYNNHCQDELKRCSSTRNSFYKTLLLERSIEGNFLFTVLV